MLMLIPHVIHYNDCVVVKKMAMKMNMVSKMDRSELEDKYIRLYEQYLVIKVHAQKQEDKIKRC